MRKINLSQEELSNLEILEKQIDNPQLLKRIQCIKLKNQKWTHAEIAKFLCVVIDTVSDRIKYYVEGGTQMLLSWKYKGKVSFLTKEQLDELKEINKKKPFDNAKEAKDLIKDKYGITYHLHHIQKMLKKNFDFHTKNKK